MSATVSPGASAGETVRTLRRALSAAEDDKIARVVAMVDALPDRGQADALIAPLRRRLAQMHLPRPLGFTRLLFTPLDPLIVPGPAWRRGAPCVPRTALLPLAALVRARLGAPSVAAIEERLAGHVIADCGLLLREGCEVWPLAARALDGAAPPPDWMAQTWTAQTGLTAADFAHLSLIVARLLDYAPALAAAAGAPDLRALAALLAGAERDAAFPALMALLLARVPGAARMLNGLESEAAETARPAIRRAREQGRAAVLERLDNPATLAGPLAQAAEEAGRGAALLDELAQYGLPGAAHRARVQEVRRNLDATCRARFQAALDAELAPPVSDGPAPDEEIEAMERAARALHRLQQAGRRIGGGAFYDAATQQAAARLAGAGAALTPIDRARLTELLLGPEAALAMLDSLNPSHPECSDTFGRFGRYSTVIASAAKQSSPA